MALSLVLSSCGLLGGDDDDQKPVVIPSLTESTPSDAAVPTATAVPTGTAAPSVLPLADPAPIVVNNTVIRTGYIRQTRTAVRNVTAVATQRVTLPQVTVTRTMMATRTVTESVPGPTTTTTIAPPPGKPSPALPG
jgi:hypothetical protein